LVYPKFLYWILKSSQILSEVQKLKVGVAQYNLSLKQIGELKIPLPSMEVQKQIVAEIEDWQKENEGLKKQMMDKEQKIKDKIASVWGE
jgi:restriction endonuclease S subunit